MISSKRIRIQLFLSTAVAASIALPARAVADPLPVPTAANPNINTVGNTETVTLTAPRTVINWNSFDIDQGFTVDFTGATAEAVLNRVVTADASNINGTLTSDPFIQVFLINPNGILFGSTAVVDVGSFVASTLGITDNDFLLGDATPAGLSLQGTNVSTGITVDNGAQLTTESGTLILTGGFINVQAGGVVSGNTDVALIAANSVTIPADPGSPLIYTFTVHAPTPVSNGISVGGNVSGENVSLYMENQASAEDALLFVSPSAQLTATRNGGGDVVLEMIGRTASDAIVSSPGRVENHGALTASGSIILGGAIATAGGTLFLPQSVVNDGTLDAGGDVLLQARELVSNSGSITAGGDVTLSAFATATSSVPDMQVINSGSITADGNVNLSADAQVSPGTSIVLLAALAPALASSPNVQVTNTGTINAGGNVSLSGSIHISDLASDTIDLSPSVQVRNDGAITADGNVTLSGVIDISGLAGSTIDVAADVMVINDGPIDAGGDVNLAGSIMISGVTSSDFSLSEIDAAANVEITNSGTISAGGDVWLSGFAGMYTFSADSILATPDVKITNNGPITAGSDVWLSGVIEVGSFAASHIDVAPIMEITNSAKIEALGSAAWISGYMDLYDLAGFASDSFLAADIAATPNLQITNSGTIEAADVAWIRGETHMTGFTASSIDVSPNMEITSRGTLKAGSAAWISASMNAGGFEGGGISASPSLQITNSGIVTATTANGSAWLSGLIDVFDLDGDSIEVTPKLEITNSGTLSAGSDAWISAYVDASGFAAPSIDVSANLAINNSGTIDPDDEAWMSGFISITDFVGTFVDVVADAAVTNSGTIKIGGNASMGAYVSVSEFAASSVDITANAQVLNSGLIDAGGAISMIGAIDVSSIAGLGGAASEVDISADVGITNSGTIKAGDFVDLSAFTIVTDVDASNLSVAANVQVTNSGTITAQGDARLYASGGDVTNSGKITADNVFISRPEFADSMLPIRDIFNSGTITARGDANLVASRNITNSGAIDVGGVAQLTAGNDIDNTGSVSAVGDAILTAGNDILDSSGTLAGSISGADVALSASGSITAGTVTARDDIAIRAPGTVTTRSLTSGATINGQGPIEVAGAADDLLPGVDLSGHDVDVDGSLIYAGIIHAIGTGSDIRLGAPVSASIDDLDFAAGGDITIEGDATGVDVAMDAGGTITAGNISARDDIALRAGDTLDVGILASGVTVDGVGPIDQTGSADTLLGESLAGHDLYVQGASVDLTQAIANGVGSDLTVRATSGQLSIANGTAGGTITLLKEGTTGILTAGTLMAGTGASLTSETDIDAQAVQTISGDVAFDAGRDVTVHSALAADDVAILAGRNISTQNISARDDIALNAAGTLSTGTLVSGVAIGGTGPVDTNGAADAQVGQALGGHDIFVQAGDVTLTQATANGAGSDLNVRATTGNLRIDNGVAGGDVNLDSAHLATVETIVAQAGDVNVLADDLDILGGVTGSTVSITNRAGGNAVTVLGDASATGAFTLTEAELNLINSDTLNIDSLDQNLLVGNVTFDNGVGSSRINLLGTGRVDIIGELDASGVTRTLQIGGTLGTADPNDPSTLASIIRIAPTSSGGGRIILGDGALDLRGAKIGVGLDDGFLQPLGLVAGGTPVSTDAVQEDWIGDFGSTLYGIPGGYADPIVISAGSITVTYTDYALFQNTGAGSNQSGVNADVLSIISSGDEGNGFELFGTINNIGGVGAALIVQPTTVSMGNSRVNSCLIVTGGGCGGGVTDISDPNVGSYVPPGQPTFTDGDPNDPVLGGASGEFAEQDLISTDEDKAFDFDSLVGTNNEGLLGVMGVDDANDPEGCTPDDKREICRPREKAHEQ